MTKNTDLTCPQYGELLADDLKTIDRVTDGYHQTETTDRKRFESFQLKPHEYTPEEAKTLLQNMQLSTALAQHFDEQHVDYVKRQTAEKHYVDHAVGRTKALHAWHVEKTANRATALESWKSFVGSSVSKLFAPGVDAAQRAEIDHQAEQQKDIVFRAEAQAEHALREIDCFLKFPSVETWNRAIGSIALIQFSAS
jgi:hypothetical protein